MQDFILTYDVSGYSEDDFDKGINLLQLLAPKDRDRTKENIMTVLAGKPAENIEYSYST